ncbi:MAG TPA: hypothetical protein VFC42_02800 [Methylomirabilota bacterium]|nr:hypothetical protein [Methylomirabilota bacterium]
MQGLGVDRTAPGKLHAAVRVKDLAAVAVNPKRPREVYVSAMDGSISRSTDGGAAWRSSR